MTKISLERISRERPVLIAGPTASGKSALAMDLAARDGRLIVNADDLAAKIEYVAADPLLRADLGNRAIARSRRFTPDVQARTMAGIYRDLLEDEQPEAALENRA